LPHTGSSQALLIVGAGPTGLTAALELSRMGVEVRIVDDEPARSAMPHAIGMGSRTLSLLEQRGLDQEILRSANRVTFGAVYGDRGLVGRVPLTWPQSRHRYNVLVDQAETRQALRHQLAAMGVRVEHATKMIALAQPEDSSSGRPDNADIRCILRNEGGQIEEVTTPYLISADGTFGTVRLMLEPSGDSRPARHGYVLAEVELDGDLPDDEISIFLGRRGFIELFPLGSHRFRCLLTDPQSRSGPPNGPVIEDIESIVDACSFTELRLRGVSWSCRLPAGPHLSPVLRHDRIFFGGDSARGYRPATGQGLDPGIHDMINLSWKLALVLRGQAVPELLQTYSEERLPAIRRAKKTAEFAANLLGTSNAIAHRLITRIAPAFLDSRFVLRLCADLAGEVITDYRESSLSAPAHAPGELQSGDFLPGIRVLACNAGGTADGLPNEVWLREIVDPSRLTALFTASAPTAAPHPSWQDRLAPWLRTMPAYRIAPVPGQQEELHRFTEMFGSTQSVVVLRPDSYVGFAGRQDAIPHLASWLSRWFPTERGYGAPSHLDAVA